MRRAGNNLRMLLEAQQRLEKGKVFTLVTNDYPKYIEDNMENINIEPIYNVNDEYFNGRNEKTEKKIIGYNISLKNK